MKKNDDDYSFVGSVAIGGVLTTFFIVIMSIASRNDKAMDEFYKTHRLVTVEHVVEEGETLESISKDYECLKEIIIRDNDLTNPDLIYPGQILQIEQYELINDLAKSR